MFAVLLAFSRISADGEYTALLASGYSLRRALMPVLALTLAAYLVATVSAVFFESWGRRETLDFYHRKTQGELDNVIRYRMKSGVFIDDFLGYVLYAENISPDRTRFENVMLAPGRKSSGQNFTLLAPAASITGSVDSGDLKMFFDYGTVYATQPDSSEVSIVKFRRAELDLIRIFKDQIFGSESLKEDYRSFTPTELWRYLETKKDAQDVSEHQDFLKARFLFHQRFSMPFACFVFALFAVVLGIQDERKGKSHSFLGVCATIVIGYVVIMAFKYLAEKGYVSAPLAAWVPQLLLLSFGLFMLYQKNRLPPSESVWDLRYIPLLRRLLPAQKGA